VSNELNIKVDKMMEILIKYCDISAFEDEITAYEVGDKKSIRNEISSLMLVLG